MDRPVRYGPSFKKPSAKVLRQARQKNGQRTFKAELRAVLDAAPVTLKAMNLLLGRTDDPQKAVAGIRTPFYNCQHEFHYLHDRHLTRGSCCATGVFA